MHRRQMPCALICNQCNWKKYIPSSPDTHSVRLTYPQCPKCATENIRTVVGLNLPHLLWRLKQTK